MSLQRHRTELRSSSSNGKGSTTKTASKSDDIDWLDVGVQLTLQLLISATSGYILMRLAKYSLLNGESSRGGENDPPPSTYMIYQRLQKIMDKRLKTTTSDNNTNNTKKRVVQKHYPLPELNSYERTIAEEIIDPDDIECSFQDVGGVDEMKREIYELAVVPLLQPELFTGKLVQPCKGILLYGLPGTGKTMLAKALAKESQSIFIPLQLSRILNKYWGESNKLIAATFSLANKLQPSIIFIDEIDTFLKNTSEQTAFMDSIKAEFLTLWDGIGTKNNCRVLVLGATNKPQYIDSAILRRMPRTFEVPLPNIKSRLAILQLLIVDENITNDVIEQLPNIAKITFGYSGSDLKELCKAAAMVGIRERTSEFARRRVMGNSSTSNITNSPVSTTKEEQVNKNNDNSDSILFDQLQNVRPICYDDFIQALQKVKRSGEAAHRYGQRSSSNMNNNSRSDNDDDDDDPNDEEKQNDPYRNNNNNGTMDSDSVGIDANAIRQFITILRALSNNNNNNNNDTTSNTGRTRTNDSSGDSKNDDNDDDDIPNLN